MARWTVSSEAVQAHQAQAATHTRALCIAARIGRPECWREPRENTEGAMPADRRG